MHPERGATYTFIVRMWREKNNGSYTWRGSVECVQNGERAYFQELGCLKKLLAQLVNGLGNENEKNTEIVHP